MNPLALLGLKALAVAAAIAALLYGIHRLDESRQQIGYERRVTEDNAALVKAQAEARETERQLNQKLEVARNEAIKRNQDIRRAAAAAADADERLRIALNTIRNSVPRDPAGAAADAPAALAELLGDCAGEYRRLAEAADGHASDVRTLSEGWPK